jgi:hypothetical protein
LSARSQFTDALKNPVGHNSEKMHTTKCSQFIAQLLYDLGLEVDPEVDPEELLPTTSVPWPPLPTCTPPSGKFLDVPLPCLTTPLPLQEMLAAHRPMTATAAGTFVTDKIFQGKAAIAAWLGSTSPSDIVAEYLIGKHDMATIYMSPDPYFEAFEEIIDLCPKRRAEDELTGFNKGRKS